MSKYTVYSATSIGGREENQDSSGVFLSDGRLIAVVCDGMGGHNGGKYAAEMAVNTIITEIKNYQADNPADALLVSIKKANSQIYKKVKLIRP